MDLVESALTGKGGAWMSFQSKDEMRHSWAHIHTIEGNLLGIYWGQNKEMGQDIVLGEQCSG